MFRGSTTVNLDEKGRFAIPTRFRDRVQVKCAGKLVVTTAFDDDGTGNSHCLWVYPATTWEELEKELGEVKKKKRGKPAIVNLIRFVIASANECEMDAQGRILLPESLRSFANLDKKIVLAGQIERFELWNEEAWLAKQSEFVQPKEKPDLSDMEDLPL